MIKCTVEGCDRELAENGLCSNHYQQDWRKRSPKYAPHRKAAALKVGRELDRNDTVVFVDGDKKNLDPDNLLVMDRSERAHYLKAQKSIKMTGAPGHNPCSYCKKWEPLLEHPKRYHNECILKYQQRKRGWV